MRSGPASTPVFVVALLSLAACDSVFGPDEDRRTGVIAHYGDPVVLSAPDTVQVGVPFEISIVTYGNGCLSEGETQVRVRGLQVDVTPYDIHSGAAACDDILNYFPHRVTLALPTPGLAHLLFHGKQEPDNLRITVGREVFVKE